MLCMAGSHIAWAANPTQNVTEQMEHVGLIKSRLTKTKIHTFLHSWSVPSVLRFVVPANALLRRQVNFWSMSLRIASPICKGCRLSEAGQWKWVQSMACFCLAAENATSIHPLHLASCVHASATQAKCAHGSRGNGVLRCSRCCMT